MRALLLILSTLAIDVTRGQQYIEPVKIEVSDIKTTNLVFPSSITSVDRGMEKLVVQKSAGNILRVKAAEPFSDETNLTVVTAEGKLYSFVASFHKVPQHLNINMGYINTVRTDSALVDGATRVSLSKPWLYGLKFTSGQVTLELNGFYVVNELVFCKLRIENRSNIIYIIEGLRIYLRSTRQNSRSAFQETDLEPVYVAGDTISVKGRSSDEVIIACRPFTVPPTQLLTIAVRERGGGRNLTITAKKKFVTRARLVEK